MLSFLKRKKKTDENVNNNQSVGDELPDIPVESNYGEKEADELGIPPSPPSLDDVNESDVLKYDNSESVNLDVESLNVGDTESNEIRSVENEIPAPVGETLPTFNEMVKETKKSKSLKSPSKIAKKTNVSTKTVKKIEKAVENDLKKDVKKEVKKDVKKNVKTAVKKVNKAVKSGLIEVEDLSKEEADKLKETVSNFRKSISSKVNGLKKTVDKYTDLKKSEDANLKKIIKEVQSEHAEVQKEHKMRQKDMIDFAKKFKNLSNSQSENFKKLVESQTSEFKKFSESQKDSLKKHSESQDIQLRRGLADVDRKVRSEMTSVESSLKKDLARFEMVLDSQKKDNDALKEINKQIKADSDAVKKRFDVQSVAMQSLTGSVRTVISEDKALLNEVTEFRKIPGLFEQLTKSVENLKAEIRGVHTRIDYFEEIIEKNNERINIFRDKINLYMRPKTPRGPQN